jgi:autotransporter-associated beta strand protein
MAVFNTPGASVLVNSVSAASIKLLQSGTISGGAIALPSVTSTASSTLINNAAGVTTISSSISLGGGYWLGNSSGTLNITGLVSDAPSTNFFTYNGNYLLSSGGTINVPSGATVLNNASGSTTNFTQTGGLFSATRTNSTVVFYLSQFGSTNYNLTGGALKVTGSAAGTGALYFNFISNPASSGTLTINGPSALVAAPQMKFVDNTTVTGSGVLNLQNGTLQTDYMYTLRPAGSFFNFSGGTLQPQDAGNGINYGFGSSTGANNISATLSTANPVISSNDASGNPQTVPIYANLLGSGTLTAIGNGTLMLAGTGSTYAGQLAINSGTVQVGNGTTITGAMTCNIANNGSLIFANPGNQTYGGSIGGGGPLTKTGAGTLTFAGSSNYSGATSIQAGTFLLAGSSSINSSSAITVGGISAAAFVQNSSATVAPNLLLSQGTLSGTGALAAVTVADNAAALIQNGYGNTSALTFGSLNFNGAATLNLSESGGAASAYPGLNVTGALTTGSSNSFGVVTINVSAPTWTSGSIYDLIGYGSLAGVGSTAFAQGSIGGLTASQSATLVTMGNNIALSVVSLGNNDKWTGLDSTSWIVGSTGANHNWTLVSGGSPVDYADTDSVLFDDTAGTSGTVEISTGNVSPGAVTFNNSSLNYSLNSQFGYGIAGLTSLVKTGSGTLTINTAGNSYSLGTFLKAGTIVLGVSNALPSGGALTMGSSTSNAILDLAGNSQQIGSLAAASGASPAGQIISNSSTNSQATLIYSGSGGSTFGGTIQDAINGGNQSVALDVSSGLLSLTGSNTFTGATTINSGTLQLGSGVAGQDGSIGSSNSIVNNGSLVFNNVGPSALSGQISGSGRLVQNGSGPLTLTGANTVNALAFNGSGSIAGGSINLNSGTALAPSLINNAAGVTTISSTMTLAGPGYWTGNSGGTLAIGGPINQTSGTNFILASGNYTLASGGTIEVPSGAVVLNTAANSTTNFTQTGGLFSASRSNANVFYLTQGLSGTSNYTITGGALTVTGSAPGSGALVVTYFNNVNGETGTLNINGATALVTTPELAIGWANDTLGKGVVNLQNGTLQTDHLFTQLASISTFNFSGGTLQPVDSAVAALGWGTSTGANNTTITLSTANPVISDNDASGSPQTVPIYANLAGSGTLTTSGNGRLILGSTGSTFSGWTNVTSGSLYVTGSLSASGSFSVAGGANFGGSGSAGPVILASGGSLEAGYNGSGSLTVAGLTFSGPTAIDVFNLGNSALPAAITVSNSNTFSMGSSTATVNFQGALQTSGTVHVIQYTGAIQGSGYGFALGTVPSPRTVISSFAYNGPYVDWIYAVDYPYWTGAGDQNWNLSSANNWTLALSGSSTTFLSGDIVVFDDRAGNSPHTVTIDAADVNPNSVTFSNSSAAYTVAGSFGITGSATTVTINGPGAVTLATSNTYGGATTLNGGTLRIGADTIVTGNTLTSSAVGTGPLVLNGGTLTSTGLVSRTISNPVTFAGNLTFGDATDTGNLIFAGSSTLSGAVQLNIENGATNLVKIGGILGGSGSPTITGNGVFFIATAPSYTSATTINGGTMEVGFGGALLSVPSVQFNLGPAGTLVYFTSAAATAQMPWSKLNGSGTFVFQGVNDNASNAGASYATFSSLVPAGFTGTIVADDAMIETLGSSGSFGGAQNVIVRDGGQLWLSQSASVGFGTGSTLHLSGPGWYSSTGLNPGALRLTAGAAWAGNIVLDDDVRIGSSNLTLASNNNGSITGTISGAHTLEVGGGNVIYGMITLAPSAANSFTALKVSGGSGGTAPTLSAGSAGAFPTAVPAALTMNGGVLQLNGFSFPFADLTGTSGTIQNGGAATAGTITVGSDNTSTTYGGTLVNGGAASLAMVKTGAGMLTLTGINAYTGGTTVNSGTLIVTNNEAIADGTSLTVGNALAFPAPVVPAPAAAASAVPEPSTVALLAAAAIAGLGLWRRRRR